MMETAAPGIQQLIFLAGLAQFGLVAGSMAIPGILNWNAELKNVSGLIKQMFWVYAAYILFLNLCFGLLSVFAVAELSDGSSLAGIICAFIAIYWISRILVQFFYFDRRNFPNGRWNRLAEVILVVLFLFLSIVYSMAFYYNYRQF